MPPYEFLCQNCNVAFGFTCSIMEYERKKKQGVKCPKCQSLKVIQQISGFQVQTFKKS